MDGCTTAIAGMQEQLADLPKQTLGAVAGSASRCEADEGVLAGGAQRASPPHAVPVRDERRAGQQIGLQLGKVGHDARGVVDDGASAVAVQVHDDQDAAG